MPSNQELNNFSQALLLVHEFYHRSDLAKEKVFVDEVRSHATRFLENAQASAKNARAVACFIRNFQKPRLTIAWVQKYTINSYLQTVVAAFALAVLSVWFDDDFGTKVCSLDILGIAVYEDKHCPNMERYKVSFLLATKQLFLWSTRLVGADIARLPLNRSLLSKKLLSHLSAK